MSPQLAGGALMVGFGLMELLRQGATAKKVVPTATDRGTSALILVAYTIAVLAFTSNLLPDVRLPFPGITAWLGVAVGAAGFAIRVWSMRVLGRFYTRTLVTTGDQVVVESGPYRKVRHPGYLGSILIWVGATMTAGNAVSLALVTVLLAVAYTHRIRTEETMLIDALGEPYTEYRRRSWRLVPFLFLLAAACGETAAAPAHAPGAASALPPIAAAAPPAPVDETSAAVPIAANDPTWGNPSAPVTIVVFSDFQCPYCAKLAGTFHQLEDAYGSGSLRIVWKHNPLAFHPAARPTAEAAAGVLALGGREAFWHFHDAAFAEPTKLSAASYATWAAAAGVNPSALADGLAAHTWAAKVDADIALAEKLSVNGAPSAFVNGVRVTGAQPLAQWQSTVDAELAKARALVTSGTPAERVYLVATAANFTAHPPPPRSAPPPKEDTATYKIPLGHAPVRGGAKAKVTIVELGDFQCPYCKRMEATLADVRTRYGDDVRIVWRDHPLPFHPRAEPAAELAREARAEGGDVAFWKAHDAIYASQPSLEDADLEAIARSVALDVDKVRKAIAQHTYRAALEADVDLADDFGAAGTPHFFVNGRRVVGAQPMEKWVSIIDEEIRHADTLLAAGVAPAALYDTMMKDATGPAVPEMRVLAVPHGAPSKGADSARVVIQQVGDFQCPFCKKAEATLKELLQHNEGKVRIVWRNLPLPMHPDAELAAEAAMEAFAQKGSTGFWRMHDILFINQAASGRPGLRRADLDGYARDLGLDMARWNAALDGHTHEDAILADAHAVNDAGITSTPGFLVGGYYLSGAQPLAKFQHLVDKVLADGPARAPILGSTDVVTGQGAAVKAGDHVSVHYVGTLENGTEFDSSRRRGTPFAFVVGAGTVIKGWDQGVVGMRVGGRRKLVIPPSLGYGERGAGTQVPPRATLVFDIELLSIE